MKYIVNGSRLLLAAAFVLSAIAKVLSIDFFDKLLLDLFMGGITNASSTDMFWIQLLSRCIISFELLLGFMLMQRAYLKKITLPAVVVLLSLFTIHLTYVGFTDGGGDFSKNCGCFGDLIPMTPLESIWKNIIMIGMSVFVLIKYEKDHGDFLPLVMPGMATVVLFGTLLLTYKSYDFLDDIKKNKGNIVITTDTAQVDNTDSLITQDSIKMNDTTSKVAVDTMNQEKVIDKPKEKPVVKTDQKDKGKEGGLTTEKPIVDKPKEKTPEQVASLYGKYKNFSGGTTVDLDKGRKMVCLFSLSCEHCQKVYQSMCQVQKSFKFPDKYIFAYGSDMELDHFFGMAGGCKDPHKLVDFDVFWPMLGDDDFPKIVLLENGKEVASWEFGDFDPSEAGGVEKVKKKLEALGW